MRESKYIDKHRLTAPALKWDPDRDTDGDSRSVFSAGDTLRDKLFTSTAPATLKQFSVGSAPPTLLEDVLEEVHTPASARGATTDDITKSADGDGDGTSGAEPAMRQRSKSL